MKLKQKREKKGVTGTTLAQAVGTDKSMISKFENYKCLPIPKMLLSICDFLDCRPLDIWTESELYIKPKIDSNLTRNEFERVNYYKFTARLPKSCCNLLQQANLSKLGYESKKDFLLKQVERFARELEKFNRLKIKGVKKHGN